MAETKGQRGQFYTTNCDYILRGLRLPAKCRLIEPFAGNGDLIEFARRMPGASRRKIEAYDIAPPAAAASRYSIVARDTIMNPPDYAGKVVMTNPPFLARNKAACKVPFDHYGVNDLYKCFIRSLILDPCAGGIIILPINFWCSIRRADADLRREFLEKYRIAAMNIFEKQVFDDTSCAICSMQFEKRASPGREQPIRATVFPGESAITFILSAAAGYVIGGEIYGLRKSRYKVERATRLNAGSEGATNIVAKCLDDNAERRIRLFMADDIEKYVDRTKNLSGRSYAALIITPQISKEVQGRLVNRVNGYIEQIRATYHSLCLTNYREAVISARKRISFGLIFTIVSHHLDDPEL